MRTIFLALVVILLSASLPAAESLARGVPEDVFLFGRWRSEPDDGIADGYLGGVREALRSSGIVGAFIDTLRTSFDGEERDDFDVETRYWKRILTDVSWWRLLSREVVFAVRMPEVNPVREPDASRARSEGRLELLFLFDVGDDARNRFLVRLRRILYGLCAVVDEYEMIVSDREGVPTSILYNALDPGEQICLGGHGRAVILATSVPILRHSLELLEGKGSRPPIVYDTAYRSGREELLAGRSSSSDPSGADAVFELLLRPAGVLEQYASLDVVERFHFFSFQKKGTIDWVLRYALRKRDGNLLARAFEDQEGVGDLLRRVPARVSAFTVEAGAEPETYYDYVLEVLGDLSGAGLLPALVDRTLRDRGFDLKDDLLRYLSGRSLTVHFPASETGEDGGDVGGGRAYLFELKPADAPVSTLTVRLESLAARLKEWGLDVERREGPGGGIFFSVDTGALLGWRLELGLTGSYLAVATSEAAIDRALAASEEGKTILDRPGDPGFNSLWERPEGTLDEVAWGSLAGDIETVAAVLRVVGGLAKSIPEGSDAGFFRPALTLLPRLQGAVRSLRFLERRIGHVVRDGMIFRGEGRIFLRPGS